MKASGFKAHYQNKQAGEKNKSSVKKGRIWAQDTRPISGVINSREGYT